MQSVVIAVVAGAIVALLYSPTRGKPAVAVAAVALVGAFGGALVGAVAGSALAGLVAGPWVGLGMVVGAFTGAAAAVTMDRRLQPVTV